MIPRTLTDGKQGFASRAAAENLEFEKAALLRDQIKELKHMRDGTKPEAKPVSYRKSKRARK